MKGFRFNLSYKLIIITLIIFLALGFTVGYIWKILEACDYFKIEYVITRAGDAATFSYLKGKNIFSINLKREAGYILQLYPDCSKIRLVRVLPNRIFIDFIKRKAVALVKLYRYFALDEEGVFFYPKQQPEELPIILGLETKIFGPKPGKKYNTRELLFALNIIREIKRNRVLKDYKIKKIDLLNSSYASIFFEDIEVKLANQDLKDKITLLADLFIQENFNLTNTNYIDLRFKEPVVKFKDAE